MRLLATTLLLFAALAPNASRAQDVTSVPALDLSRYAGEWHEIARLPMYFQRQCRSEVTAQYTLREDGLVGVRNRCKTDDGTFDVVDGVARVDARHPGRLEVRFAPDWLAWMPMVWADYWVIALDPGYQWAMVGEPDRDYLWILSRTPTMERAQFDALKAQAEAMGYDLSELLTSGTVR